MTKFTFFTLLVAVSLVGCTYDNELDLGIKTPGNLTDTISYSAKVRPIVISKCAISGCHVAGSKTGRDDFNVDQKFFSSKETSRDYILNGFMPRKGELSFAQKDTIVSWINQQILKENLDK